ncbi:MAG: hypothetical protein U0X20_12995 [Caldilineaceae bacterium]
MAVDNMQSSSSSQQSTQHTTATYTTTYATNTDASARKRAEIGLAPERETAPEAVMRPPDESSRTPHWLLVVCVGLLGVAVLLLLLGRIVNPNATLAELFGFPASIQTGQTITVNTSSLKSTAAAYLAQLPGFRLWLTDDFAAPSKFVPAQAVPGQVNAAVMTDIGVYRMQVEPYQMGWTLFDLADLTSYHLETSANVSAETPGGAAGLIARFGGPGNFYLLTVDGAGTPTVQLWSEGQAVTLQAEQAVVKPAGQANRLAVEDDGARIRFYVNQALVSEIVDPQLPPGRPGLAAAAPSEEPATVDFDWIAIYQPE